MSRLSAFELLALSEEEQLIVRCLAQQPGATLADLAQCVPLSEQELEVQIKRLVQESRLVEQLRDGQRIFSVRFSRERQRIRNISPAILGLFAQSADAFLRADALASMLDEHARQALLSKSTTRTLMPGEVYIWQGSRTDHLGLVRMGLMKKACLRGKLQEETVKGYVGCSEWFGISESFSEFPAADTYTAVIETDLILWSTDDFLEFVGQQARFGLALLTSISRQLHQQAEHRSQAQLWVVSALNAHEDAALFAVNLACVAAENAQATHHEDLRPVLLWHVHQQGDGSIGKWKHSRPQRTQNLPQHALLEYDDGVDILLETESSDYPAEVQLDILLTALQQRYRYVVCDTGTYAENELILRLRGRAETVITVTQDRAGTPAVGEHWSHHKSFARPGQKRMMVLYDQTETPQAVDPAFHLALPMDALALAAARQQELPVVKAAPQSLLSRGLQELYRRLTLNHSIGIFIPSTLDVDRPIDNKPYVQSTLSFLGTLFGGATRNQAEGAWSSDTSGLVVEPITIVRSFVSENALHTYLDSVITFVTGLKKELQQEAIAIDVDSQLILI
jgi:CRP-like cAMP-binding protein